MDNAKLLADAVSHLQEGVLITEDELDWPNPRIVYVNDAMCRITGYSADELVGQSPRMLQGDGTDRRTLDRLKEELAAQRSFSCELINYRKNGEAYPAELFITPVFDSAGRRRNFISIHRDVLASKRREAELREAYQRLEAIVESSSDAIISKSLDGTIETWNESAARIYGYSADEVIGQPISILSPPNRLEEIAEILKRIQNGERIENFETVRVCKHGRRLDISLSVSPIRNRVGEIVGASSIARDITQRKRIERALRDSEERTRAILTSLPVHIAVLDQDGTIVAVNTAWEQFARENQGQSDRCNVGANYLDVCRNATGPYSNEAATVLAGLRAILDGTANEFHMEYPCHSPEQRRWFLLHATSLHLPTGGAVVSHLRITERVLAEQNVREREERLRAILNTANDAIITIDRRGIITGINPATERMFGYRENELVGSNVNILMPSPYREQHDAYIQRYLQSGDPKIIGVGREVLGRRKDGATFPIDLAVSEIDHLLIFTGIIRDISDRKHAESQLREQASLLERTREAVMVRDMSDRIVYWNHGAEQLYGWTAQEAIGSYGHQLLFREYPNELLDAHQTLREYGEWSGAIQHRTKTGDDVVVESYWSLLLDEDGRPKGKLIIDIDVTDKRRLESHLLRAQRLESIGTLAGGIAHDLNNLFTPVMLMIKLLRRELHDADHLHLLDTAQKSMERGSEMIRQLLSFAGGIEGDRKPVDVHLLVGELRSILEHTLPKSIETIFDVPDDLWMVVGDATQLSQVLLNLCINARDAMLEGGQLHLAFYNRTIDGNYSKYHIDAHPGRYIEFVVSDTGVGIPKEAIDKIFDPFFTTKELGKGTGLGLSTVLGIVKGHGGFLNVYSEIDKGTAVSIFIPATPTDSRRHEFPPHPEQPVATGAKILVVDDEDFLLQMTTMTLERFGYEVKATTSGQVALQLFRDAEQPFDAVVLDMMMPEMEGKDVIHELRTRNSIVPIIACSGLHSLSRERDAIEAGATAFLEKPFSDDQLHELLQKLLKH